MTISSPRPQVAKVATLSGHHDCVYALSGAPHEPHVYSAGTDGFVVRWSVDDPTQDGVLVARVENSVYALRYVPERNWLLIGHNFQGVQAIDLAVPQLVHATALPPVAIFDILYAAALERVYVALGNGALAVLHATDLRLLRVVPLAEKSLRCLSLHAERGELAVGSSDAAIYILDADTLAVRQVLSGPTNSVFTVAYSPDGRYLLAAGRDAHVRRWAVGAPYVAEQAIVAHLFAINHLTFSPDGRFMATCSMDKSVKIWSAESLQLLRVVDRARHAGHGTSVNKLFWSGRQNRLVSCSDDRSLVVWQVLPA